MYNNEPFEEYIRQVLGYHNIEKSTNNDFTNNNYNYLRTNENELENYYPEIYKIVYPMINQKCTRMSGEITKEKIEEATLEIVSTIEPQVNETKMNINIQNEMTQTTSATKSISSNRKDTNSNNISTNSKENRSAEESRISNNRNLNDLIKILIIRELLGKPGGGGIRPNPRPPFPPGLGPRPPFPPGGRPPVGPPPQPRGYFEYNDIYEY